MVKGRTLISLEDVLKHTNGGWDVFSSEIKGLKVGAAFKSPLRKDNHPSVSLACRDGIWTLKDFSTGEVYSAIKFVQVKYNLTFQDAISKIAQDSGLKDVIGKVYKSVQMPDIQKLEKEIHFDFFPKKWTKRHFQFWEYTEVDEAHCKRYNTFAIKEAAINHTRIHIGKDEVAWAYVADNGKMKFYFPEREKGERFKGNIRGTHLWNFDNMEKCEKIVVIKSMKDLLVSTILFPCITATQNEDAKIFSPSIVKKLEEKGGKIYIFYGSDDQGKGESIKITKEHGWHWINTPNEYLPDVNDAYSLCKKTKSNKALEELFRKKRII